MPFRIGPLELVLILVIVLLIFGAGRLPEIGSALGKSIRAFRSSAGGADKEKNDKEQALGPTPPSQNKQ